MAGRYNLGGGVMRGGGTLRRVWWAMEDPSQHGYEDYRMHVKVLELNFILPSPHILIF